MKTGDKQNPQQQVMIMTGIVALAILFLFKQFAYNPLQDKITAINGNLASVQQKLQEARSVADKKEIIDRDTANLQKKLAYMSEMLPQKKEIPKIVKIITTKANESSVRFVALRPSTIVAREFYNEVPIELNVKANFNNLGQFFTRIGNLNRIANVEGVQITPSGSIDSMRETINASFVIKTFTYAEGGGI